jgi:NADH dehydrogenase FAD-containing subunit
MRFKISDGAMMCGLECAREPDRAEVDVLLLDRGGYRLFTRLLYQVATALLNPSEIAYPLRSMFTPSEEIPYEHLVLATGSANDYHGNEQLAVGDAAGAEQSGKELPMVSAPANQAGRYVARAIRAITLASWAWYCLRLDRPIRIIVQTPPDQIVAALRSQDPDEKNAVPAETHDGGRTL